MVERTLQRVLALVLMLFVAGCATPPQRTATDFRRTDLPPRLVLMPLDVELSSLSAGGVTEPNAEWTEAAQKNMKLALADEARTRRIVVEAYRDDRGTPEDRETADELIRLHRAVGAAIMLHDFVPGFALPSRQKGATWGLGPEAAAIARSQDADYALFFHVRDSYASAGRVAVMVVGAILGVGIPGGVQVGFASIVDLKSGEIVWFNRLVRPAGDLRTVEAARETVTALLQDAPK